MKHLRIFLILLAFALLLPAASCKGSGEPRSATYYEYFDTVTAVRSYADESKESFERNAAEAEALLKKYHRLLDIYREYDGVNNLCTVNKNAGIAPVKIEPELVDILLYAKKIYALTGGECNVAMGSVLTLWHEARESEKAALPDEEALTEAAKHTDIDSIVINEEASTVYISDGKTRIDVGAIGKGYAAERVAEHLISLGASSYVLDLGGNLRLIGEKPNGGGWVTGITNPDEKSDEPYAKRLMLSDVSCVTSGDYERYVTVDGKRYHHIIDKDTNAPAEYFSSVSVITKDSALADALSTALFCMPYEDGLRLCENIGQVEVIWIKKDGTLLSTDGINEISVN